MTSSSAQRHGEGQKPPQGISYNPYSSIHVCVYVFIHLLIMYLSVIVYVYIYILYMCICRLIHVFLYVYVNIHIQMSFHVLSHSALFHDTIIS